MNKLLKRLPFILIILTIIFTLIPSLPISANYGDTAQDLSSGTNYQYLIVSRDQSVCQSWIAQSSYIMTGLRLRLSNNLDFGEYTICIAISHSSNPGTPISHASIGSFATTYGTYSEVTFTLDQSIYITQGETYCWSIFIPQADAISSVKVGNLVESGSTYSDACIATPNPQPGNGWWWDPGLSSWVSQSNPCKFTTIGTNAIPTASIINLPVSYLRSTDEWQISAKITGLGSSSTGVVWFDYGTTTEMGIYAQPTSSDGLGTLRFTIPKNQYINGDTIYAKALLVLQPPLATVSTDPYNFSTANPNVTSASLTTIKARETGNGVIYAGGIINSFGLDSTVKADIVYGLAAGSEPFETPIFTNLKDTGVTSSYTVDFPVLESGVTIYYKAHIYGTLGGDSYGQEEQFNVDDYGVSNSAAVQTLDVKDYSYNTATLPMMFLSLGSNATSLDLSMWYSTSNAPGATYVQTDVLSAQTDVGHYDFKITGLQSDTNYYYYAGGYSTTGGVTTDVRGDIHTFRTKGISGGGGLVDKGNNWLLSHGLNKNFWWVVVFVLMCLPWVFGSIREMPIVGIIIDVVALGIGVTMLFDPWVTIIIAIFAAVIVGGWFIRKVVKQE